MRTRFQPLPDGEPPLTVSQFHARLENDPAFVARLQAHFEEMLATPRTPETEEMHQAAAGALSALKHDLACRKAYPWLQEAMRLADPARGEISGEDVERIRQLTDSASDELLDAQEPERTQLMTLLTLIRSQVRALIEMDSDP